MKRSTNRILTTHVGSLIRPPRLLELVRAREKGAAADVQAYEQCLKESVAEVVRRQAQAGHRHRQRRRIRQVHQLGALCTEAGQRLRDAPGQTRRRSICAWRGQRALQGILRGTGRWKRSHLVERDEARGGVRRSREVHRPRRTSARHRQPESSAARSKSGGSVPARSPLPPARFRTERTNITRTKKNS